SPEKWDTRALAGRAMAEPEPLEYGASVRATLGVRIEEIGREQSEIYRRFGAEALHRRRPQADFLALELPAVERQRPRERKVQYHADAVPVRRPVHGLAGSLFRRHERSRSNALRLHAARLERARGEPEIDEHHTSPIGNQH